MNRKYGSIAAQIDLTIAPEIGWDTDRSLLDFDVVLFAPNAALAAHSARVSRTASTMYNMAPVFSKRLDDLAAFQRHKGIVVIFVGGWEPLYVVKGGGAISQIDTNMRLYGSKLDVTSGQEVEIFPNLPKYFNDFFAETAGIYSYKAVINSPKGIPLLRIRRTSQVVASCLWSEEEKILFLPQLQFESYEQGAYFLNDLDKLLDQLEAAHSSTKNSLPEHHINYALNFEAPLLEQQNLLERRLAEINHDIEEISTALLIEQEFKHLFLSKGSALVEAVRSALTFLGFTASDGPIGRDDLICQSPEGKLVVEVKGRDNKSAAERDCAQLEKWAAREIEETNIAAKPLLVINAFSNLPLKERIEPVFPHQMVGYAVKRDHCLCSGLDLLAMVTKAKKFPESKEAIRKKIYETVGIFQWDELPTWEQCVTIRSV